MSSDMERHLFSKKHGTLLTKRRALFSGCLLLAGALCLAACGHSDLEVIARLQEETIKERTIEAGYETTFSAVEKTLLASGYPIARAHREEGLIETHYLKSNCFAPGRKGCRCKITARLDREAKGITRVRLDITGETFSPSQQAWTHTPNYMLPKLYADYFTEIALRARPPRYRPVFSYLGQ